MNFSLSEFLQNGSPFKKNFELFEKRFPSLSALLKDAASQFLVYSDTLSTEDSLELIPAKDGALTAKENGLSLHSLYSPLKEAERAVSLVPENAGAAVFFSFGLGHALRAAAEHFPSLPLIVIEPDPFHLFLSFATIDWEPVFRHEQLILCTGAQEHQIIPLLEKYGFDSLFLFRTPSWENHAKQYYANVDTLIQRNRQKQSINNRTLKTFSALWFRNMCTNLNELAERSGITGFKDCAADIPACVLAAGPSLERVLPFLSEIKKRCILVCVDTALRACLAQGVEPHFVILGDPQYWNARHLDRLSAPNSILITESAAYPSVFRFNCREIVLCSSMFPLGQYIEKRIGEKGVLGTGGSVASTAWDFARYCGCRKIYLAGLDLGFPAGKTHVTGSTFEEKAFTQSDRIKNAETFMAGALFGAYSEIRKDYNGNDLRTDKRMSMYAWWFESKCAEFTDVKTYSLTSESLAIPGITSTSVEALISSPEREKQVTDALETAIRNNSRENPEQRRKLLSEAIRELRATLSSLLATVDAALDACDTECHAEAEYAATLRILENFDSLIRKNEASELTALLFPTKEDLEKELAELPPVPENTPFRPYIMNIASSRLIYINLKKSISAWLAELPA